MSTFIRKDSKKGIYSYWFKLGGHEFSGSTGKTSKREADQFERIKRTEAEASLKANKAALGDRLTLELAAARWYDEVGQHHRNSARALTSVRWLLDHFGSGTMLESINDNLIAHMVAKRRMDFDERITAGEKRLVGPATVNRTATIPLRQIMVRARKVWKVACQRIEWSEHLLAEPKERVREASVEEEAEIGSQLSRGYDTAVEFSFLTGCRKKEVLGLVWSKVDFFRREFHVLGKRDKWRTIPMTQEVFDLLWAEQGNHKEKVFTFVASMSRGDKRKGERYALTGEGYASAMERAVARAGVENFRLHDTRHTAASRMARTTNLKVVQRFLGHSDIKTTLRYVHVDDADVRAAMEGMRAAAKAGATQSPTESPTERTLKVVK